MVLIICVVHEMHCKHYFLEIVRMYIMSIVLPINYNWHWFLQLRMSVIFEISFFIWTILSMLSLLLLSVLLSCRLFREMKLSICWLLESMILNVGPIKLVICNDQELPLEFSLWLCKEHQLAKCLNILVIILKMEDLRLKFVRFTKTWQVLNLCSSCT